MRKAVIDLGTNTFNLLIADVSESDFRVLHTEKEGVALGLGGINENTISADAFERGVHAMEYFHKVCFALKVERIMAFGTSALRNASNTNAFLERVRQKTGIRVKVISGMQEATLIHAGVQAGCHFKGKAVIMDIGGGSTEFIFTDGDRIRKMHSLEIGVSRMFQAFEFSDPYSEEDIRKLETYLEAGANGVFDNINEETLIGASGSFETFYELTVRKNFPDKLHAIQVDFEAFMQTLDAMIASTAEERKRNPLIIPIRKKMGPIAAVKIRWFIRKTGIKQVYISPASLKEGALITA